MLEILEQLKSVSFLNNSLYNYSMFLLVFLGVMLALKIFQSFVLGKVRKIAEKTENTLDDAVIDTLQKIRAPFYFFVSFWCAMQFIALPDLAARLLQVFFIFGIAFEVIKSVGDLVDWFIEFYIAKMVKKEQEKKQMRSLFRIFRVFVNIVLWSITLLFILSNLGVNVTSIVASLGIGGLAIALAVQNVLSDIFSAFSIYLDKPFEVGDFIIVGEDSGTVEHIGMKTTRLRTLRGEVLIISNKELTSIRVKNLRRLKKRRDSFMIGIEYETAKAKMKKVPAIIEKIIKADENANFLRCHLFEFGDSSINYEVVYTVNSADYDVFMDVRQGINLAILKEFENEGIGFAYPSQRIFLEK